MFRSGRDRIDLAKVWRLMRCMNDIPSLMSDQRGGRKMTNFGNLILSDLSIEVYEIFNGLQFDYLV